MNNRHAKSAWMPNAQTPHNCWILAGSNPRSLKYRWWMPGRSVIMPEGTHSLPHVRVSCRNRVVNALSKPIATRTDTLADSASVSATLCRPQRQQLTKFPVIESTHHVHGDALRPFYMGCGALIVCQLFRTWPFLSRSGIIYQSAFLFHEVNDRLPHGYSTLSASRLELVFDIDWDASQIHN